MKTAAKESIKRVGMGLSMILGKDGSPTRKPDGRGCGASHAFRVAAGCLWLVILHT